MINDIYEVHCLFPPGFPDAEVARPMLHIPEIPMVGDRVSFEGLRLEGEWHREFIVAARRFHFRGDTIAVATITLTQGDPDGVLIARTK